MATDIHPFIMGPHAIASFNARMQAIKAYGIDPHALMINQESRLPKIEEKTRALAKTSKATRALAIQTDHEIMVI